MHADPLDELEEGEILDDDATPVIVNQKKLPKRYKLHDKNHKHKKTNKHSAQHFEKIGKAVKINGHKLGCPHASEKNRKRKKCSSPLKIKPVNVFNSKNKASFKSLSLYEEMKSNFNCSNVHKKVDDPNKIQTRPSISNENNNPFSDILSNYEKLQNSSKIRLTEGQMKNVPEKSQENLIEKFNEENTVIVNGTVGVNTTENNSEESEDEEELRKIALATCSKRFRSENDYENGSPNINSASSVVNESNSCFLPQPSLNDLSSNKNVVDNYEVVDMEVDEDVQNQSQGIEKNDLFFIDPNPSDIKNVQHSSLPIKENLSDKVLSITSSQLDEDFELELTRAELVASLIRRSEAKCSDNNIGKSLEEDTFSNFSEKSTSKFGNHEKKRSVLFKNALNVSSNISDAQSLPQEPFIIRLSNESSSDESEDEVKSELKEVPENDVASLEALISDAKNKSSESNKDIMVPEKVANLSKAQQEEYSLLMKILAKKGKTTNNEQTKNVISPFNLKMLEKKLIIASSNLGKEKQVLAVAKQEYQKQRSLFLKSNLKVQKLKEQLIAAEKVRKTNQNLFTNAANRLQTLTKAFKKREALIQSLKSSYSKLESQIKSQNYFLPSNSTLSRLKISDLS